MSSLLIEIRKEKRTGAILVLLAAGILGSLYAFVNFILRKESLLSLPIPPMDILLTQLYGMIMVLNLFSIVMATCIIYNMEFQGNAIKKMYTLPMSITKLFQTKFIILATTLLFAVVFQNLALAQIGLTDFPTGTFELRTLIAFAAYSYVTSMPVLTFMLLISSRFENMWVSLGIGIAGFLSGMAMATIKNNLFMFHPFVLMFCPALAMNSKPNPTVILIALIEGLCFYVVGIWMSQKTSYE